MSKLSYRDDAPDHLSLGTFTYDPSAPSHIQTFNVDPAIVDLGVDVGVVIFRVNSNWGGDLTCLYRVSTSRWGLADGSRSGCMATQWSEQLYMMTILMLTNKRCILGYRQLPLVVRRD